MWIAARLLFACSGAVSAPETVLTPLDLIARRLDAVVGSWMAPLADPFVRRVVALEALAWALGGYAIAAALGTRAADVHLRAEELIRPGLLSSGLLLAFLLWLSLLLFRGSSRAHRFWIETAVLLALSVPVAGVQGYADLNRALDRAADLRATAEITDRERREHRGRRGSRYYTYHLNLRPITVPRGLYLPTSIQVDFGLFRAAGKTLRLTIGPGAFAHPWYRSLTVGP